VDERVALVARAFETFGPTSPGQVDGVLVHVTAR
jgi:hypothetical protein